MANNDDRSFMSRALAEAQAALNAGDYPVGAALTVNGVLWGTARNALFSEGRTTAHAEHTLIYTHSAPLRAAFLSGTNPHICLYTTLEPCLMCLGIAVMHRVSRIVVACPDPNGGTTGVDLSSLGSVYQLWWPTFEIGMFQEESCDLIIAFLKRGVFRSWKTMLVQFETLQNQWRDTQHGS